MQVQIEETTSKRKRKRSKNEDSEDDEEEAADSESTNGKTISTKKLKTLNNSTGKICRFDCLPFQLAKLHVVIFFRREAER